MGPRKRANFSETLNQDKKESNSHSDQNTKKDQSKNKKIYILGDSKIKNLERWEMFKKLKTENIYVRHFPGTKVSCMKDHIKP